MYIQKLSLSNFRGAPNLELTLHKKLNIFCGVNGSGKTTILDAAAILLSWAVNRIRYERASGRPIQEKDIRNSNSTAMLGIVCLDERQEVDWKLVKSRKGHLSSEERTTLSKLTEYTRRQQHTIDGDENHQVNLPLFVYYPVNRAVLDIPLRIRKRHRFNLLDAYDDALISGANFRNFFEWFREREDLENEVRRDQQSLFSKNEGCFPDPQLEAVRQALEELMPDFINFSIRRNPLRMEVIKDGKTLTVGQLSDGEKCLMAMVGDLARRMAIANPQRNNPLEGEGIVLIDEIDLHFHPKWQRMIIPKLVAVFPNCQFLITTHSPHVITHVQPENLFMLEQTNEGLVATHPNESYGKNVDRVLEDLMGLLTTRPDQVTARLNDLYEKIDKNHLSKAQQLIQEIKNEIGEDPDLVKARVLIRRREIIGK